MLFLPVDLQKKSYRIKERSVLAKLASVVLGERPMAVVIGETIHLHGVSATDFRQNLRWLRHELAHVRQFREHGFLPFLARYLAESIRKGYRNNKYEIEAREAELKD